MKCRKVNVPCATPASDGDLRHVDGTKQGVVGMVYLLRTTKDLDCWVAHDSGSMLLWRWFYERDIFERDVLAHFVCYALVELGDLAMYIHLPCIR